MKIQRLFIYPIKSLPPVEVSSADVTSEGFRFDRQYIIIKVPSSGSTQYVEYLTIKKVFSLALFHPSIDDKWSWLTVRHVSDGPDSSITIPLTPSPVTCSDAASYHVNIYGTSAIGIDMGDAPAKFFSKHTGLDARLLFIGGDGWRDIPGAPFISSLLAKDAPAPLRLGDVLQPQRIRFADAAPFLVTSSSSTDETCSRLPQSSQSEDIVPRFRPNIHIDVENTLPPFDEDNWKELAVYSKFSRTRKAIIYCIFKTARCLSLNVEYATGTVPPRERQLYGLLARDRRVNRIFPHKPVFGQYALVTPIDVTLRVGDEIQIINRADQQQPGGQ